MNEATQAIIFHAICPHCSEKLDSRDIPEHVMKTCKGGCGLVDLKARYDAVRIGSAKAVAAKAVLMQAMAAIAKKGPKGHQFARIWIAKADAAGRKSNPADAVEAQLN